MKSNQSAICLKREGRKHHRYQKHPWKNNREGVGLAHQHFEAPSFSHTDRLLTGRGKGTQKHPRRQFAATRTQVGKVSWHGWETWTPISRPWQSSPISHIPPTMGHSSQSIDLGCYCLYPPFLPQGSSDSQLCSVTLLNRLPNMWL